MSLSLSTHSHVALVYDASCEDPDAVLIVEATAASGVHLAFLAKYRSRCKIASTHGDEHDWYQVRAFLVFPDRPSTWRKTSAGRPARAASRSSIARAAFTPARRLLLKSVADR